MQYDFAIPGGGGIDISAVGSYIKYKSGLGAIRVRMNSGGYVDLTPGQGIRLNREFTGFNISDRSGNANAGIVLAGNYEFQDDSIAGSVSIIDGGVNSTLAQKCFLANCDSGVVTGNYNSAIFGNLAGNNKNVILQSMTVTVPAATQVLLTLSGNPAGATITGYNKAGQVAPVSTAVMGPGFGGNIALMGQIFMRLYMAANQPFVVRFAEPVVITPGRSVSAINITAAATVTANYEFREELI